MTSVSGMAAALKEALSLRVAMRADGATPEELERHLENVVRIVWPRRETPWRFYCDRCEDRGWSLERCTATARCGRPYPRNGDDLFFTSRHCQDDAGFEHTYVARCSCAAGMRLRPLALTSPREDVAEAGRARPRKMTRSWER